MARLRDLVIDCRHPASLARFWAAALDDHAVAPYDDQEMERLRSMGILDVEDDPTVLVEPTGAGPRLWFQLVPEPRIVKNRMHLDLIADHPRDEIDRLVALGARVASEQPNESLVVLHDPEGNEFCVLLA